MTWIYKICTNEEWGETETSGVFPGAPVDIADGFIHFSIGKQVNETAARHFAGQENLLLLSVCAEDLGPALKWETSRGGELFPHLYGVLTRDQVKRIDSLPLGPEGRKFPAHVCAS